MKIGIIGGGISGTFLAIKVKELHPEYDVDIFEHNDKLIKKIYATGNGKCNFANSGDLKNKYKNEDFVLPILSEYSYKDVAEYFEKIGIPNVLEDNLAYPISKSAQTVGVMLEKRCNELETKIHLGCNVLGYEMKNQKWIIKTNCGDYSFDKIIVAAGGKSSPQLGSDGSIFDVLKSHNYDLVKMNPSLCPIKTKENTKLVEGVRANVKISIFDGQNMIHEEVGEMLFKDNGLSGIVIFNACHYINMCKGDNVSIRVDFIHEISKNPAKTQYFSYVHPKLAKYLVDNNLDIHDTVFNFKGFYDYSTSQVTSGGVNLKNVNSTLESKLENGVYFVGEVLDVDAICGGFNMMWCFASAMKVAKEI